MSGDAFDAGTGGVPDLFRELMGDDAITAYGTYKWALEAGIAKETART